MATTTTTHDLKTVEGVLAYLASTPFAAQSATLLAGGTTNFCFRIQLKTPYKGHETLVIKHSKSITIPRHGSSFEFTAGRQNFEVGTLRRMHENIDVTAGVLTPEIHLHDEVNYLIVMDDAGPGSIPLKQRILDGTLTVEQTARIGKDLGTFLARLHAWGLSDTSAKTWMADNKVACEVAAMTTYGRILPALDGTFTLPELKDPPLRDELSQEVLDTVAEVVRIRTEQITNPTGGITMGDVWPGNMLVRPDNRILFVDWEMAKLGLPGCDIGQMLGDLRVLLHWNAGRRDIVEPLVRGLLDEYARLNGEGEWLSIAASQIGTHCLSWGPWIPYPDRTKEGLRRLATIGVGLVVDGYKQHWTAQTLADRVLTL